MLWLLPRQSFAPMVALLIALLQTLGVPISWKKLRLGYSLEYLGWLLCLESGPGCFRASMLEDKRMRILRTIAWWVRHPRSVKRRELRQFLGLLVWATQVNISLRPFLAPLFSALNKPCSRLQRLSLAQLEELRAIMGSKPTKPKLFWGFRASAPRTPLHQGDGGGGLGN